MRKLILRNYQSPGDIVMLTAAVRDLHRQHHGRFVTDVRTSCAYLWENNPYITCIAENDPDAEVIDCRYPLIHASNQRPYHFVHAFIHFLSHHLKVSIEPTVFKGDIHLSRAEKSQASPLQQISCEKIPYWIIVAGGKYDYTIKWWDVKRFQEVVDHFRGKICFVQIGESSHYHPALSGVVDLRGKTDRRELIRMMYHAEGVVCPVTLAMHLAAAVEVKGGSPKNRPCVVVAGGREPPHWETYPYHQYLHTVGSLPCCSAGGCWKSRTTPLGDGDGKDKSSSLCVDVVNNLPKCMDMINAQDVIRHVELYFQGGVTRYLTPLEFDRIKPCLVDERGARS